MILGLDHNQLQWYSFSKTTIGFLVNSHKYFPRSTKEYVKLIAVYIQENQPNSVLTWVVFTKENHIFSFKNGFLESSSNMSIDSIDIQLNYDQLNKMCSSSQSSSYIFNGIFLKEIDLIDFYSVTNVLFVFSNFIKNTIASNLFFKVRSIYFDQYIKKIVIEEEFYKMGNYYFIL